jgi:hypothetical protein
MKGTSSNSGWLNKEAALRPALERDFAELGRLDVPEFIEAMRPFLSDLDAACARR